MKLTPLDRNFRNLSSLMKDVHSYYTNFILFVIKKNLTYFSLLIKYKIRVKFFRNELRETMLV